MHITSMQSRNEATFRSSAGPELIASEDFTKPQTLPTLPVYLLLQQKRDANFYGRDDILQAIDDKLLPGKKPSISPDDPGGNPSFALCGLGGVGKTAIAIEYAYSRMSQFDGLFWVSADSATKADESFGQIALAIGLFDASDAGNLVVSRSLLLEWLSNPIKDVLGSKVCQWLMVLDNVDDLDVLIDYWPSGNNGSILITSRDPLAKSFNHLSSGMDLQTFGGKDTEAFLQRLSQNNADSPSEKESLKALSERLGGHALAITTLSAIIKHQDLSFEEMLSLMVKEEQFNSRQKLSVSEFGNTYKYSLAFTLVPDVRPPVKRFLDVLSILDPDSIHESIVIPGDLPLLPGYPSSQEDYYDARSELLKRLLIARNKSLKELRIHRLIQSIVVEQMSNATLRETFQFALDLLWRAWPKEPQALSHGTPTWKVAEKLYPHISRLSDLAESRKLDMGSKIGYVLGGLIQKGSW